MEELNTNQLRGKKWADKKKQLELQNLPDEIAWMDSQPAIVADIQEYEDSIKPKDKPKDKPKKASKEA